MKSVAHSSLAAEQPIPEGGVLLEANGESLSGLDHSTVGVILDSTPRPLTLKIALPELG